MLTDSFGGLNMTTLQFTLFSTTGKYKPMSTLLEVPSVREYNNNSSKYKEQAIVKICIKNRTDTYYLNKYGFTKIKVRVYDKEKIEQENKERYERIKRERGWT